MMNQSLHSQMLEPDSNNCPQISDVHVSSRNLDTKQEKNKDGSLLESKSAFSKVVTAGDTASQLEQLKAENALLIKQVAEQALELRNAQTESLQAVELKAQFMANISHELRTPMSGVLGMAELLREMPLTQEQAELVNYIYISAGGLVDVINTLLDFSRLQAGKLRLERSKFSLSKTLSTVDVLLGELARKKGLKFRTVVQDGVPELLVGDEQRIRQVLSGLVNNAIKFTAKGSIQISVELEKRFEDIAVLRFRVKDTGIGVETSELDRIFLPFVQADGSNTRKYGGVGLGLPICTRLVKLMSGSMTLKSKVGNGSTFIFNLPLEVQK